MPKINHEDILKIIDDVDNDDENEGKLKTAMEFFCSNYDKCEGYKHALVMCIQDQYKNHANEQDPRDLEQLKKILS